MNSLLPAEKPRSYKIKFRILYRDPADAAVIGEWFGYLDALFNSCASVNHSAISWTTYGKLHGRLYTSKLCSVSLMFRHRPNADEPFTIVQGLHDLDTGKFVHIHSQSRGYPPLPALLFNRLHTTLFSTSTCATHVPTLFIPGAVADPRLARLKRKQTQQLSETLPVKRAGASYHPTLQDAVEMVDVPVEEF
jgi:hypothetical protein